MAEIDKRTIKHLSRLCRIDCSEGEIESLLQELKCILSYIDQLHELNTDDVPPCNHVLDDVMRDDQPGPSMDHDFFLSNAPDHIDGLIRIPTVMKQHP